MTETIYKKDSKGKIRQVTISALGDVVTQQSGLVGGNLTTHQSVSKPKNIGRSNETTSTEQAVLEAIAKITKKLKEGYFTTIEEAETEVVILPMLAKEYGKEKHKIDWSNPVWIQPKLDGMRCISFPGNRKISRKNTPIDTMNHISVFQTAEAMDSGVVTEYITDGELYIHGETFQDNMRAIKKYREGVSENVKYHIYDIVSEQNISDRIQIAMDIALHSENCIWVPSISISSEEEIDEFHAKFISEGYEGSIIRWGTDGYAINKRSSNLLKKKDFLDEIYELVDIEPADKSPEQGVAVCKMETGQVFRANFAMSHAIREELLLTKDEYIGQMAEIRFFEFTDDGIPRFPVCHGFRLDR